MPGDDLIAEAVAPLRIDRENRQAEARQEVSQLADNFHRHFLSQKNAPLISDLVKEREAEAEGYEQTAQQLKAPLSDLDKWGAATKSFADDPESQKLRKADLKEREAIAAARESAARHLEEVASLERERGGHWQISGGPVDAYSMVHGTAKDQLADECYEVFTTHRHGTVPLTKNSDFHKFVRLVYQTATHQHPEIRQRPEPSLLYNVQKIIRQRRG